MDLQEDYYIIEPEERLTEAAALTYLQSKMRDKEWWVLTARALGFTLKDIGDDLSVGAERVRQIEAHAHRKAAWYLRRNFPELCPSRAQRA